MLTTAIAEWVLGLVQSDLLPEVATAALSEGADSGALRRLAALTEHDGRDAEELFRLAVHELGLTLPSKADAARIYTRHIAQKIVSGHLEPYEGTKAIWPAYLAVDDPEFHDLDAFVYASCSGKLSMMRC